MFSHRLKKKADAGKGDYDTNEENEDLFAPSERPSTYNYFSGLPDTTNSMIGVEHTDDKGHVERLKVHVREAPPVSQYIPIRNFIESPAAL